MTRKKKSRKPGVGSSGARKTDLAATAVAHDKKPKKKTGKAAGSRQLEGTQKAKSSTANRTNKDPRIGSKKAIELVPNVKTEPKPIKRKSSQPIAKVRVVDNGPSIAQQLAAIEADERLQLILAKQEQEQELTAEEVDYYNQLMEQYETLSAQIEQEESQTESTGSDKSLGDDDLWDKLDSSDFSDYE